MNIKNQAVTTGTSPRKLAAAAGVLYLITHVTSIGAVIFYDPLLKNASYVTGTGSDTQVILGALLDIILALAVVGTSVALYPVVRKWHEGIALGYVGLRTLEAGIIAAGVILLLAAVTLRQHGNGSADPATLVTLSSALVAGYTWTTLLGPGLVCGVNTVLMAYLMYTSRLVPRFIPMLGLVGGPLIFAITIGRMFDVFEPMSVCVGIAVIPIFAWELSLATRLIIRGFNTSVTAPESIRATANALPNAA
jgi:hypothetical protein